MNAYRKTRKGFTLVEILIVVIILGILAAIVIPQFTNASSDARKSNMASQLQTLKSQVQLYKLQHNDQLPGAASAGAVDFWTALTKSTDVTGVVTASGGTTQTYGPYLPEKSINPMTNSSTIGAYTTGSNSPAAATDGWEYILATGELHGISVSPSGTVFVTDDGYHQISDGALVQ